MNRIRYIILLSKYIKNYTIKLIASIIIHGLYKVMPIALGVETSYIVSRALSGTLDDPMYHFFIVLFMVILTSILNYLDIYVSHDVAYRILTQLRSISYERLVNIAPAGIESEKSGNIMSIILEDIEILEWFYAHSIIQIIISILLPIIALFIIGIYSYWISIIILLSILIMLMQPIKLSKKSDTQGYKLQRKLGELNSTIIGGIQGIKEIIIFQWQKNFFKKMYKINDEYNRALYKYTKRAVSEISTVNMIIGISSVISTVVVMYFAHKGRYKYEMILPLVSLSTMIYLPLQETLLMSSNYGRIFASAKRVFDFLQLESSVIDEGKYKFIDVISEENKKVTFDSVFFSYRGEKSGGIHSIIKGLSFDIYVDQTTVLVGASGSGKSTCSKLLQRFWDVDSGKILINGIDIKDIKLEELKKLITVVPQEVYLFNKSIKENLLLAKEDATEEEIEEAIKKANLKDFIYNLKDGLDTVVGEKGTKLSGGERQRISIAQAFLKNSPVLILDEITSNLDYNNERAINDSIKKLKKGKITFMIAHRVSTIKNAENIVFIKDGICAGNGKYDDLIAENEDFRNLLGVN